MSFAIYLTADAARDLEEIYDHIALHDAPGKAEHVLKRIENAFKSLADFSERGAYPKELLSLGIRDYREVFFKPYRLIYRVLRDAVYILPIADGRRDMQTLLQRRLLKA